MKRLYIYIISKLLAFKRRLYIIIYNVYNPYPKIPKKMFFSPSYIIKDNANLTYNKLNYSVNKMPHYQWKKKAKKKFIDLLSLNKNLYFKEVSRCNMPIKKGYSRIRIYAEFSKHRHAPIDIITNDKFTVFKGTIICMQGTNSGAHLSLGEIKMPADIYKVTNGSAIALQAADEGFIAISYERIGFGERQERKLQKSNSSPTIDFSFHSLILNNTSLGETVSEISLLVKWLKNNYKNHSVWLKGYSAAGTAALVTAATDNNIDGIAIGGCIGLTKDTLLNRGATGYNDIPNLHAWMDQDTIISLVSPRPCIIVAGIKDHIWPYSFAIKALKLPKTIYKLDNFETNLVLVKAKEGHTYYPNLMWPLIVKYFDNKTKKSIY